MFAIWWPRTMSFTFFVLLPRLHHKSMQMLALPGVFSQMPTHPSHHMAKLPAGTTSCSISSLSQVPHSGNVLRIQLSLVISLTLLMGKLRWT